MNKYLVVFQHQQSLTEITQVISAACEQAATRKATEPNGSVWCYTTPLKEGDMSYDIPF